MWLKYEGDSYYVHWAPNGWQITDYNMAKVCNIKLRKALRQMYQDQQENAVTFKRAAYSLDYIPPTIEEAICRTLEQEKEYNMGFDNYSLETEQRNHLKRRLERVFCDKTDGLDKAYNLTFEGKTKEEIKAALVAGSIEFEDYFFDKNGLLKAGYRAEGSFYLVNPLVDKDGAAKAREAIQAAYTAAKDQILVLPLADGLKALQDFEAKTFWA